MTMNIVCYFYTVFELIFWPSISTASSLAISSISDKIFRQLKTETKTKLGYENTVYFSAHEIRIKTIPWKDIVPV